MVPLVSGGSMAYSQIVNAAFGVFLAPFLGADAFGSINLARNILINAVVLTPLGLDQALQRHFGERGEAAGCGELAWLRLAALALSCGIALALVFGGAGFAQQHLFRHAGFGAVLAVTLLALPFNTDMMVLGGAYRGRHRPVPSVVATFMVQPTLRIAAVLILCLWMSRLWAAIDGMLISFVVTWLLLAGQARRDFPVRPAALRPALPLAGAVLRYAPVLGLSTVFFTMAKTMDVTALGLFADLGEVGRYSVVVMVCQLVGTVGNALGVTIGASVAAAEKVGDRTRLVALLAENMHLSAIFSAPLCVATAAWGSDVDLLLGPRYAVVPGVFAVAALTQWVTTVTHSCSAALSMTGRHNVELANNALALAVEVAACALLVPRYGMMGAALATAAMVVTLNVVRQVQIGRMLGRNVAGRGLLAPLAVSAALAAPLLWAGEAAGFRAWWLTGLLAGTHILVTLAAMLALMTSAEQRRLILGRFRRG